MPVRREPRQPEDARREIESAYQRAKAANPRLTRGEYYRKASPTFSARYDEAKSPAERKRIEQSAARYERLIRQGKRTGRVTVEKAYEYTTGYGQDQYQVIVFDAYGNAHSFNIRAVGGRSTLDIPLLEQRIRENPEILGRKYAEFAARYHVADIDIANAVVRRVQKMRARAEILRL